MLQRMMTSAAAGPTPAGPLRSDMTCTPEQQALVELPIVPGRCVIVDAVPGAGKTSTCLERDIRLGGCHRVMFMYTLNATQLAIEHSADRKFAVTPAGVRSATSWLSMLDRPRRLYTVAAVALKLVKDTAPAAPDAHTTHTRLDSFVDAVVPLVDCLRLCNNKTKGIPSGAGPRGRPPTLADVFGDRDHRTRIAMARVRRWTTQFDDTPATSFAAVVGWPCGWRALAAQWFASIYGIEASDPTAGCQPSFYAKILKAWQRYAKDVVAPLMAAWGLGAALPALPGDTPEAATEFMECVLAEIAAGVPGEACAEVVAAPRTYRMTVFDYAATVVASYVLLHNLYNVSSPKPFYEFFTLKVSWFPDTVQWDHFAHVKEVIVDEAADISLHQRAILHRFLAQGKQVVAMGDRNQQICQFSGTNNFVADPGCDPDTTTTLRLRLSISFRLPAVVRDLAYEVGDKAPGSRIRLACECPGEAVGVPPRPGSVVVTRTPLDKVVSSLADKAESGVHAAVIVRSNAAVAAAVEAVCGNTYGLSVLVTGQVRCDLFKALDPVHAAEAEHKLKSWSEGGGFNAGDADGDADDRWVQFYYHIFRVSAQPDWWRAWMGNKTKRQQRVYKDSESPVGAPAIFVGNQYSVKGGEWGTVVVGSDVVNWRLPAVAKSEADRNLEYVALTRSYGNQVVLLPVDTRREDIHPSYRAVVDAHLDHTGYAGATPPP
jgi:hypothetical protein